MSERIGSQRVPRESGYLYYLGSDGYLWRTPTKQNPSGQKARAGSEKITREPGFMYFLDADGYIARSTMKAAATSSTSGKTGA